MRRPAAPSASTNRVADRAVRAMMSPSRAPSQRDREVGDRSLGTPTQAIVLDPDDRIVRSSLASNARYQVQTAKHLPVDAPAASTPRCLHPALDTSI